MTQEESRKEAWRNEPMATDGCILTNNEEIDGHRATVVWKGWQKGKEARWESNGVSDVQSGKDCERNDRDRKSVTTGRGKTERRDAVVGDERKEQAGKMNWSWKTGRQSRQEVRGLQRHPGEQNRVCVCVFLAECHGSCHPGQITIMTHLGSNPSGRLIKPLSFFFA